MYQIVRAYVGNCGYRRAWYDGQVFPFSDLGSDAPMNTVIHLENQGGKTTLLSLLLSVFDTQQSRFLQHMVNSAHEFLDYFTEQPAIIALEWEMEAANQSSMIDEHHERLVTGQIVAVRQVAGKNVAERHFFSFLTAPGLGLRDLPGPGLVDKAKEIRTLDQARRWLHDMSDAWRGNFWHTEHQGKWDEHLRNDRGLDTELVRMLVDFNRREGSPDEDFLKFRDEAAFLGLFLNRTLKPDLAEAVRKTLLAGCDKLRDRPRLKSNRIVLEEFQQAFHPFGTAAAAWLAAQQTTGVAQTQAASALAAVIARKGQHEQDAASEKVTAQGHEKDAAQAQDDAAAAWSRHETLSQMLLDAQAAGTEGAQDDAVDDHERLKRQQRYLAAADSLSRLNARQASIDQLNATIAQASQGIEPLRAEACTTGAQLRRAIGREQTRLEDDAVDRQKALVDARGQIDRIEADIRQTETAEQQAQRQKAVHDDRIDRWQKARERLVRDGALNQDEAAADAIVRLDADIQSAIQSAAQAQATVKSVTGQIDTLRGEDSGLRASLGSDETQLNHLRASVDRGRQQREAIEKDPLVQIAIASDVVDVDSPLLPAALRDLIASEEKGVRDLERRGELLAIDIRSIEETGLAGSDEDVRAVVKWLRQNGVRSAQPYAEYLAAVLPDPALARDVVLSDPARFLGVAVDTADQLASASALAPDSLRLRRPVVVSQTQDVPDPSANRLTLAPMDDSLFNRQQANEALIRQLRPELDTINQNLQDSRSRLEAARTSANALQQYLKDFGGGELARLEREAQAHDDRITRNRQRLAEIAREVEGLQRQVDAAAKAATDWTHKERSLGRVRDGVQTFIDEHDSGVRQAREESARAGAEIIRLDGARHELKRQLADANSRCGIIKGELDAIGQTRTSLQQEIAAIACPTAAEATQYAAVVDGQGTLAEIRSRHAVAKQVYEDAVNQRVSGHQASLKTLQDEQASAQKDHHQKYGDIVETELQPLLATPDFHAAHNTLQQQIDNAFRELQRLTGQSARDRSIADTYRRNRKHPDVPIPEAAGWDAQQRTSEADDARAQALDAESRLKQANDAQQHAEGRARDLSELARRMASAGQIVATRLPDEMKAAAVRDDSLIPDWDQVDSRMTALAQAITQAENEVKAREQALDRAWRQVRAILGKSEFRQFEGRLATMFDTNEMKDTARDHVRLETHIHDRINAIDHHLQTMDADLDTCVNALLGLTNEAIHLLARATRTKKIPDGAPIVGGLPILQMRKDFNRYDTAARQDAVRNYVDDMVRDNVVPRTGAEMAAAVLGRIVTGQLGLRILKMVDDPVDQYVPVDAITNSGSEGISTALFLYFLMANLRAEKRAVSRGPQRGLVILDNPFAKVNKPAIWETLRQLAHAMGVQMIIATAATETNVLEKFFRFVRLRPGKINKTTQYHHVELVDFQMAAATAAAAATTAATATAPAGDAA